MADTDQKPRNFLQTLVDELIDQSAWARRMLTDETASKAMMSDLGLDPKKMSPLPEEAASITAYREAATSGDRVKKQVILDALSDIFALYEAIVSIGEAAYDAEGGEEKAKEAAREAAHHLVNLLLVNWLRLRLPKLYKLGQVLGFVEEISSTNFSEKVYFDRIPAFLTDPGGHLSDTFGSLDTEQDAKSLSDHIFPLVATILAWQGRQEETHGKRQFLPDFFATKNIIYGWDRAPGSTTEIADEISARAFSVAFESRKQDADGGAVENELDLTLLLVPRSDGGPGVFLSFGGAFEFEDRISDNWRLKLETRTTGAFDLLLGPDVEAGGPSDGSVSLTVGPEPSAPGQKNVFPDSQGMRLEFGRLSFKGEISKSGAGFEVVAEDGAFVISTDECDGFVAEVLPGEKAKPAGGNGSKAKETRIDFTLGLGLSSERGFYITGGAGLQLVIPLGKSIGPVTIQQLLLRLAPSTDPKPARLTAEVSAGISARLGPITAVVDQIGMRAVVPFGKNNEGEYDFDIGFKPPTGVGLQIESAAVTGGGFLFYDSERGQYGGVLNLVLTRSHITLKAVGLISTQLPGGAKGFSMIVIVTAEGFKPIPLGLGFTLTGVGGLVAVNRTFNEEAVGEGIKSHMLERVLFPKDPIKNAPQIISSLETFFPAKQGSYLFGFLAQISWGPGSPVKMELGLILEVGKRLRLIVLGRVSATLPREEHDLVRLNMDAIGIIDFDQGTASIDAALYDSRLLKKFVLTGQMAMRLRWSGSPLFALSVGGFHPAFKPPTGFPALERIALSLSEISDFRLRCEGYFALTSNTLQFGARAELMAKA
ncbi:MAG TPA: DUF6603 domain-containing protein, partial [Pyrinomonadaceae bacterium]|nr:DUF6603 domain-containing protein [Pyrinomonadaceae bacterium]